MIRTNQNTRIHRISAKSALFVALLVMCSALSACSDKAPHSLRVEGLEMVISTQNDTCLGSETNTKMFLAEGIMDIRFAESYTVFPVLHNVMQSSTLLTTEKKHHAETHHMYIVGVTFEYTVSADTKGKELDAVLPSTFFRHTSGFLPVGESRIIPVAAIPPELGQVIKNSGVVEPLFKSLEILVHMTYEAQLLDGKTIQSNEYIFPLRICNGCLLRTPIEGDCCSLTGEFIYPCRFGNDETIDCRACCEHFGENAVDTSGGPLCENPSCGDGICNEPQETSATCPADCG